VFRSSNVTVANNTCYNNYIDPYNQASARACIDEIPGSESLPATVRASTASCQ